jgi:threonine/homoserine/homoserine lactone efflux protein
LFHTAAVAVGVAAIFATSALAFTILKIAGAAYLVYLAWVAFRTKGAAQLAGEAKPVSGRNLYLRGVIMNITNPKVAIFSWPFFLNSLTHPKGP